MGIVIVKVLCICIVTAAVETLHGIVRNTFVSPRIGHRLAKRLSLISGSLLAFGVCYLLVPWTGVGGTGQLLFMGVTIALFMLLFDIVLGRSVLKLPWKVVLADLDVLHGGYLLLGLAALAASPLAAMYLRSARPMVP
jgi:hypothetical protein